MKSYNQLMEELGERKDFKVLRTAISGGAGIFTKGPLKNMTVIWTHTGGWEHVSIDGKHRTPTWDEMCMLKDMFWRKDETCVEFHPAESEYVNMLDHCLHIWRPIPQYNGEMPVPSSLKAGTKTERRKDETETGSTVPDEDNSGESPEEG